MDLVNRAALKKKGPKPAVLNVLRAAVRSTVTKRFDTAKVTSGQEPHRQDSAWDHFRVNTGIGMAITTKWPGVFTQDWFLGECKVYDKRITRKRKSYYY